MERYGGFPIDVQAVAHWATDRREAVRIARLDQK